MQAATSWCWSHGAGPGEPHEPQRLAVPVLRFLAPAWRKWLCFAQILGNIQFTILLSVMYFTMFTLWAIPYKIFSDRLALRNPQRARWIRREPGTNWLDSMRKQG